MPISARMHLPDRFDEHREFDDELPELPIPRPGEGRPDQPVAAHPVALPSSPAPLGGGASFTAASEGEEALEPARGPDELVRSEPASRFTWEIAARLTAGMLANPSRNAASVKDAMAMFDQFLHEVHSYERLASSADLSDEDGLRLRRERGAYFQSAQGRSHGDAAPREERPAAPPQARPQPTQPAPMAGYQPLPPHMRAPYMPDGLNRPFGESLPGSDAA